MIFHFMDGLSDRRLADMELPGGLGHIQGFADGQENTEMAQRHKVVPLNS